MAYVSKVWVDRQTEYPTRRKLAFDDGTGDKIVTVSREEGQIYEAGDIFDANTMNNMESRIAAGIGEKQNILIPGNGIRIDQDDVISATGGGGGIEFTKIESGSLVSVNDTADLPVVDLAVEIKAVQSGSGDPSPSNVRPISGWSSVGVTRAGKNLINWKVSATTFEFLLPSGSYILSSNGTLATGLWYFRGYDADGNLYTSKDALGLGSAWTHSSSSHWNYAQGSATFAFTVPSGCSKMEIFKQNADGTIDCQIELGSTATSYEPYNATTVTIALGQTVYGGSLDVTSGVLTVTWAIATFDKNTTGWSWQDSTKQAYISTALSSAPAKYNAVEVTHICNILRPCSNGARPNYIGNFSALISSGSGVAFSAPNCNSLADFTDWLTNNDITIQFVYELAQPVTVQLTPTEIETLLGINNIWADSGDILNLEYYTQSASDVRDFIIKDEEVTDDASWSSEKIQDELDAKQDSLTAGDGIVFDGNEISAVLYKELTATLNVFSTSVVFEDSSITTSSVIDIYTSKYGFNPETVTAETGRLTITFRQPDEQITVKVRIS